MRLKRKHVMGGAAAAMALGLASASWAAGAAAPDEVHTLDGQTITLHPLPFLKADELSMLRLVATNRQALALFVPKPGGYAAIAVSPKEGFLRDGQPVPSASARSGLPDAAAARRAALATCNKARKSGPDCVIVLQVAPKR